MDAAEGGGPAVAWRAAAAAPAFASPAVVPACGTVVLACADGAMRGFSHGGGTASWVLAAGGGALFATPCPLWASPPATAGGALMLAGGDDGRLLCVEGGEGRVAWEAPLHAASGRGRRLVASAAVDDAPPPPAWPAGSRLVLCLLASPGEAVLLATPPGEGPPCELARLPLPADCFSSPVLRGGLALLGCRDDSLYGLACAWPERPPGGG